MFAQEHGNYLDKFFARRPNPSISWIHDFGKRRYGPASESLLLEAETASELETKHVGTRLLFRKHSAHGHDRYLARTESRKALTSCSIT